MRRFAGIELGDDRTTILHFRRLPKRRRSAQAIFAEVNAYRSDGQGHRPGLRYTPIDVTVVDAPSSTGNKAKACDKKMSSTEKGNHRYFGTKANVGADTCRTREVL